MKKILYYFVKTVSTILTAVVLVVCIVCGYLLFCNLTKMEVPTLGPYQIYVVLSDSMYPMMRTDDAIIIEKTEPDKLNVQDIITFRAFESDIIITHRITAKNQTDGGYEFNTKGDNNNTEDNFVTPESRVIGKYMFVIPQFGSFITTVNGNPFMVAVPVIIFMAVQFLLGLIEDKLNPNPKKIKEKKTKVKYVIPSIIVPEVKFEDNTDGNNNINAVIDDKSEKVPEQSDTVEKEGGEIEEKENNGG